MGRVYQPLKGNGQSGGARKCSDLKLLNGMAYLSVGIGDGHF